MNARDILDYIEVEMPKVLIQDPALRNEVMNRAALEIVVQTPGIKYSVRETGAFAHPKVGDIKLYYQERILQALMDLRGGGSE